MSARQIALLIALAGAAPPAAYAAGEVGTRPDGATVEKSMPAPQDCRRMARHDHGANKGTPTPASVQCKTKPVRASDPSAPKAGAGTMGHDHARFHKQM